MSRISRVTVPILALALALSAAVVPASAETREAAEDRQALWITPFEGDRPYDSHVYGTGVVLDPTSGDVFAARYDDDFDERIRVSRLDGETGSSEWEIGLGPDKESDLADLAIDPAGQRIVLVSALRSGAVAHSLDLQGTVQWSVPLSARECEGPCRGAGTLQDVEVNPRTGTACVTRVSKASAKWGTPTAWRLDCVDRNGATVMNREFRHGGADSGDTALAVDPTRNRWYLAGAHLKGRDTRTVLLAFREGRERVWRRTRDLRGTTKTTDVTLAVDTASHRIHVAGHHSAGAHRGNRITLVSWSATGHRKADRAWRAERAHRAEAIAVDPRSHRIFVAAAGTYANTVRVRVMRANGKPIRTIKHTRGETDVAQIEIDPKRRLVLIGARTVAAYTWNGTKVWQDATRMWFDELVAYRAESAAYDQERGRLVVGWSHNDDPAPDTYVSGWQVG
ncbi:hypothetical protein [Nocardioides houyundeii]|uniref:hypothetical protein n=1 Tax=Nocardioides houyundeii TaxID=2045452 RepID=UPI000DF2D956|nr:hypothetical protein [Nocardioides houyundeii]